jgi:hypothetical protein
MNKKIAVSVILLAFVCVFGCKKESKPPLAVAVNGIINFVTGTVKLEVKGAVTDAKIGDTVVEGAKISTVGSKSIAEIYIGDHAIKVTGDSSIAFPRLVLLNGGQVTDLSVTKGGVFSKITKKLDKNDSFTVRTPTAVAAVRGTEFMVEETDGKSNIACVDGKVEVADTQNAEKNVVLDAKEEVTVDKGGDLVKKQIESDKLIRLQLIANIKDIQADIKQKYEDQKADMRKKFEEQREQIRQAVVDQREKDKGMVQKQKDDDKARVEAQKETDKANIEAIKSGANQAASDATGAAKAAADATKADTSSAKSAADEQKAAVKPEIKKNKIDPNQFKTQK